MSLMTLRPLPDGRWRWEVAGRPFRVLGGESHNSAGSTRAHLAQVVARARDLGCNTLLSPISWELFEPVEGRFDPTQIDDALSQCRQHGLRWIPLWFGSSKNTDASYAPPWVKLDQRRFPRAQHRAGEPSRRPCIFGPGWAEADAHAFAAMLRYLHAHDDAGTCVAVQVENEVGQLEASRDRHPLAEAAIAQETPAELLAALSPDLRPEVALPWIAAGRRRSGTWRTVFGSAADEIFMAWHFARFVQHIAIAGRSAYAVPLLVNAWIVQHPGEAAGSYPSGGPVAGMIDVWRIAAPAITAYGCDIYTDDFVGVCADYQQRGNPLLIPEHRRENQLAAKCWYAFGQHDALMFAPFGIESLGCGQTPSIDGVVAVGTTACECNAHGADLLRQTYVLLANLLPAIDALLGTPRCVGVLQTSDAATTITVGGWSFRCHWLAPQDRAGPGAGGLIASPHDGEFLVAGYGFRLEPLAPPWEFLGLHAGTWSDGRFITQLHLNGDEGGIRLGSAPGCRRFRIRCIG